MKKRIKKLALAKETLLKLEEKTVQGGSYYFDIHSNTAGFDDCICPRQMGGG